MSGEFRNTAAFRRSLAACCGSGLIAMLYSLMHLTFSEEKRSLYPADPNPAANWVIIALFLAGALYLAACLWNWLGERIAGVVTLVFGGTGIVGGWAYPESLVPLFGRNATFLSYCTILAGLLAIAYTWVFLNGTNKPKA